VEFRGDSPVEYWCEEEPEEPEPFGAVFRKILRRTTPRAVTAPTVRKAWLLAFPNRLVQSFTRRFRGNVSHDCEPG
jgi:hypothetical protein